MQETWRWFGPDDAITLEQIRQAGATGIVSALDHVATGEAWAVEEILERKRIIEAAGMRWSVVESVPVHNDIKTRSGDFLRHIGNYQQSIRNLGACGIGTVCYNFMPVVDWTRTNLAYELPNRSHALRFEMSDFAVYDIHVLEREGAARDYAPNVLARAEAQAEAQADERIPHEEEIVAAIEKLRRVQDERKKRYLIS